MAREAWPSWCWTAGSSICSTCLKQARLFRVPCQDREGGSRIGPPAWGKAYPACLVGRGDPRPFPRHPQGDRPPYASRRPRPADQCHPALQPPRHPFTFPLAVEPAQAKGTAMNGNGYKSLGNPCSLICVDWVQAQLNLVWISSDRHGTDRRPVQSRQRERQAHEEHLALPQARQVDQPFGNRHPASEQQLVNCLVLLGMD